MERMDVMEAMRRRHSVRAYRDDPLPADVLEQLTDVIALCNREGGLKFRLITDEPRAFDAPIAHYGHFSGVKNYVALIGDKAPDLEERVGYWGEHLALKAQQLGLNTCWVALSYSKRRSQARPAKGEKCPCVLTVGYGQTEGRARRSRSVEEVARTADGSPLPDWFRAGVEAALLAPTAVNQQKFLFTLQPDGSVHLKALTGPYARVDIGIVRYHFEAATGKTPLLT